MPTQRKQLLSRYDDSVEASSSVMIISAAIMGWSLWVSKDVERNSKTSASDIPSRQVIVYSQWDLRESNLGRKMANFPSQISKPYSFLVNKPLQSYRKSSEEARVARLDGEDMTRQSVSQPLFYLGWSTGWEIVPRGNRDDSTILEDFFWNCSTSS